MSLREFIQLVLFYARFKGIHTAELSDILERVENGQHRANHRQSALLSLVAMIEAQIRLITHSYHSDQSTAVE